MKRQHVHVSVDNLDESIRCYSGMSDAVHRTCRKSGFVLLLNY